MNPGNIKHEIKDIRSALESKTFYVYRRTADNPGDPERVFRVKRRNGRIELYMRDSKWYPLNPTDRLNLQ